MNRLVTRTWSARAVRAAALLVSGVLACAAGIALATPAAADPPPAGVSPVAQRGPNGVTADVLPTVQIDGVVWSTTTVGNAVYAGGNFANARPAGAAAGTNLTPRANLLAFDIGTGNLNTTFAPALNAQVKIVAKSPDGTRVYVGGSFTQANGSARYRLAAYDTTTGSLVSSFAPSLDATVNAITVSNTTVYVGGAFSTANGQPRTRLAAFNASNGALSSWAPTASATVNALQLTPDGSRVIVGGAFQTLNGSPAYGLGALDSSTAVLYPWAANQTVRDAGANASILTLSTDGTAIYSTAFVYTNDGNFEGVMSADPNSGTINWLADCHGDTYGAFSVNGAVYSVGHQHFCSNIGGFPDTNPRSVWHRTTAFTTQATGTVLPQGQPGTGYGNFGGFASPSLIDWLPDLDIGTFTGQGQAAWTVTGNSQYVVEGGEFPKVNGVAQQGLVRFGVPSVAPNKQGPRLSATGIATSTVARSASSARVSWGSNWDRDDMNLTYNVYRQDKGTATPLYSITAASQSWNLPSIGFVDTGLTPGQTYQYRVRVGDASGNVAWGNWTPVTLAATSNADSPYVKDVLNAGASSYWRLGQPDGSTLGLDYAGFSDLALTSVTGATPGAIAGDADTASTFAGTAASIASTSTAIPGPDTFTESAWFSTTTTAGGKIIGFGDKSTGTSSNYDRHIYMDAAGRINFGVYRNGSFVLTSPASYNDGQYHQVVASLSPSGMVLYIDGRFIGSRNDTTTGQPYSGYWRIGGDSSWSGGNFFKGSIDEVAVFPTALTAAQVRQQYVDSGRSFPGQTAPADDYGKAVWNDAPIAYFRLNETSGTAANDLSGNGNNGTYQGGVTKGVASPVTGTSDSAATFNGSTGFVSASQQLSAPAVYSEESWFRTTSTNGGKLLGFGNASTGNSTNYDRHVYMLSDGKLVFGTNGAQLSLATSPASYNDGSWHHVVATQGAAGMTLYVDGASVATNPATGAEAYSGYWRLGGDNLTGWSANGSYFPGSLDEAAFYGTELSAARVAAHYYASPLAVRTAPVATFTGTPVRASVAFDASASTAPNSTITGYSWDFGDGASGSGVSPTHEYAASGIYQVSLTLATSSGSTASVTQAITVTVPNKAPVASFTATPSDLSVAFDGSSSVDADGSVAAYSWDFGDGTAASGTQPTHPYAAAGVYTVTLTVTDDDAATGTASKGVTVAVPNQPPTASFSVVLNELTGSFDAAASADPDGTVSSYAWDFGDGTTASGVVSTHAFMTAGMYAVSLKVTDNRGASVTTTKSVSVVAPNQLPTAVFTSSVVGRTVAFDAAGSTDPDGTIASYSWEFGDGSTNTTSAPAHTYATDGDFVASLQVADNRGGTASTLRTVTVSATALPAASDTFTRSATSSWGSADIGGSWGLTGGVTAFSVSGGQGVVTLSAAGASPVALLTGVSVKDLDAVVDTSVGKMATGNGTYAVLVARRIGNSDYRLRERFMADGTMHLAWTKVVGGKETVVSERVVAGLTYAAGDVFRVRFQVTGKADGTTTLAGKVWKPATLEPAAAQLTGTDNEPTLQAAGGFGISSILGSTSTNAPVTMTYDNLSVTGG